MYERLPGSSGRRRFLLITFMIAIAGAVVGMGAMQAGAVDPIVDFKTYPPALPASCAADGNTILTGLNFSVGSRSSGSLRDLQISAGELLTMTWTGFAPGCEAVGIGLSIKTSNSTVFVETDNQYVVDWSFCGPQGPLCAAPFSLALRVPPVATVPCWQLDAHIGPPLAIIGPGGAFYGLGQPRTYLISARNDGVPPCTYPPCSSDPAIPAPAAVCKPGPSPTTTTTTTTTTVPTTTTAPTTTTVPRCALDPSLPATSPNCPNPPKPTVPCSVNPAIPADSPDCKPAPKCEANQVVDPVTGACVVVATKVIPVTGIEAKPLVLLGAFLLTIGGPLALLSRRARRQAFSR